MSEAISPERVGRCYSIARNALLAERNERGHWTGELSASALSTATAVMALELVRRAHSLALNSQRSILSAPTDHRAPLTPLIRDGLRWLAEHQNADGGWGDTTKSLSNVSTTMLSRAVFRATGTEDEYRAVVDAAVKYIDAAGGVPAVLARYGNDRTFSIPILTHCALAGLVDWREVKPLPFELACLPARFYKTVRLPVVSYALPALIAIGQVRHHFRRPWNPLTRLIRRLAIVPSLRRLEQIQPANGGFLEATPLTSFVTMSLAGMGLAEHPVARRGAEFIMNSARPDGSWPIDTNLATWVTTLAVNALGDDLPEDAREPILRWLLDQQYQTVHPYTNADPGGWAWTDLPGGVPDADDTAGAVLALLELVGGSWSVVRGSRMIDERQASASAHIDRQLISRARNAVVRGLWWLVHLQNRDGGCPTFCRGWGKLAFDRSSADITAHVLRSQFAAFTAFFPRDPDAYPSVATVLTGWWMGDWITAASIPGPVQFRVPRSFRRGFDYISKVQRADGSWLPLWFGNQHADDEMNATYGTARVLAGLRGVARFASEPVRRGLNSLIANQNPDGGWGGVRGTPSSVEETALATEILLSFDPHGEATRHGVAWLLDRVEDGSFREPAPIGFYFAKLWYFERLYPLIFTTAALRRARRVYSEQSQPERETNPSAHHERHESYEKGT